MQFGVEYEKSRLHGMRYFRQLLGDNQWLGEQTLPLLKFNEQQIRTLEQMDKRVLKVLSKEPVLQQRFEALTMIDGVGPVSALTWALEIGTPERFESIKRVQSYCGLTSAFWESAGKQKHGPISKQRNAHLQSVVIEAAKVAPMHNETLKAAYDKARAKGADNNLATLEVARKLVGYLLAADRGAVSRCQKLAQPA
jgi:transposase